MIALAIILAIVIGVALILIEIIIVPGLGICGIGGGILTLFAYYMSFSNYGTTWGIVSVAASLLLLAAFWYILINSRFAKVMHLKTTIDSQVAEDNSAHVAIGARAKALTRMNLVGRIEVDGQEYEGRATTFLEAGTPLEVIGIEDNIVLVKEVNA